LVVKNSQILIEGYLSVDPSTWNSALIFYFEKRIKHIGTFSIQRKDDLQRKPLE